MTRRACWPGPMCHEIDHLDGHLFIDVMEEELFDDDEEVLDGEIADDEE